MMDDLSKLEAKAKAATPGPWVGGREMTREGNCRIWTADGKYVASPYGPNEAHDAAFIAAINPSVVLGLIARIRAAEGTQAEEPK
jgi:hypothetical protein